METIEFLNIEFLDNSLKDYLFFLLALIIGFFVIIPTKSLIIRLLSNLFGKDQNDTDTQNSCFSPHFTNKIENTGNENKSELF